jgi:uncharacterized repeat protein (TIGR01451 family)
MIKTTDGGYTWNKLTLASDRIWSLAIDPITPSRVYAGAIFGEKAFITKLSPSGKTFTFSSLLGGTGQDFGDAITTDPSGNAIVVGSTNSGDFPTASALQPAIAGGFEMFVIKFDPLGAIVFSTFLGGTDSQTAAAVRTDLSGNIYIAGQTRSTNFPVANPIQASIGGPSGDQDAFVLELNRSGSAIQYATYLGGSAIDRATGLAVDSFANTYVCGTTSSADFPETGSPSQSRGLSDGFVARIGVTNPSPSYSVHFSASPPAAATGETVTYTIRVENNSQFPVNSVNITDNLPDSLRFVSCSASAGACGESGNLVSGNIPSILPGQAAVLTILAQVDCSLPSTARVLNEVVVKAASQNSTSAQAVVAVFDPLPTLTCPLNVTTQASSPSGSAVQYLPIVDDNCAGISVVCVPPSGSVFPVGSTTVFCSATDSGGLRASCSINVAVTTASVPSITDVTVAGKHLVVTGRGFEVGSLILKNGVAQKTTNDVGNQATILIGKKLAKRIAPGETVVIQVLNSSGIQSAPFVFRRSV